MRSLPQRPKEKGREEVFKEEEVKVNEWKGEMVNEVTVRPEVNRVVVRKERLEEEKAETDELKKAAKICVGGR